MVTFAPDLVVTFAPDLVVTFAPDYAYLPLKLLDGYNLIDTLNDIRNINTVSSDLEELELISNKKCSYLFEPTFTIRFGFKKFKFQLQGTRVINLTSNSLAFERFNFSTGLVFSISQKFKKHLKE